MGERKLMSILCRSHLAATVATVALSMLAGSASAALPEGRSFEQVSPEFKAGYPLAGAGGAEFALSGESAVFASIGAFSNSGASYALNFYGAKRTPDGWTTTGLYPSPTNDQCWRAIEETPPDLSKFEYQVSPGASSVQCEFADADSLSVQQSDGSFTKASSELATENGSEIAIAVVGSSLDLSRFVVSYDEDHAAYHLVSPECGEAPVDERHESQELFELSGCELRLVGVDEQGKQISHYCSTELGGGTGNAFEAVSEPSAGEVFFSVAIDSLEPVSAKKCGSEGVEPIQLFARMNGRETLNISSPLPGSCTEEPCEAAATALPTNATFQGASEDGSRVFFTTTQPLVNEDKDTANDLYMATIGCADAVGEACGSAPREVVSLARVSRDPHAGEPADVENGVTALSPDGSHVYFVARGDLLGVAEEKELESAGRPLPQAGAENLYAYDVANGRPAFIADLCSGPEVSGTVNDRGCPASLVGGSNIGDRNDSGLWTVDRVDHEAQTTADGETLVFSTFAQLISTGPERDADSARDVYIYDAGSGRLRRVSLGEDGASGNGNGSFDASIRPTFFNGRLPEQYELDSRSVDAGGDTVVFSSAEKLSPRATNGRQNVYAWHQGSVGLISSGAATEDDEVVGITPNGGDLFFMTSADLLPSDTDGLRDMYDARIDGGFPEPPGATEPCQSEVCRGPLSTPSPLLVPGSVSQSAGGNVAKLVVTPKRKVVKKPRKKKRRRQTKKIAGGKAKKALRGRGGR